MTEISFSERIPCPGAGRKASDPYALRDRCTWCAHMVRVNTDGTVGRHYEKESNDV